MILKNSVRILIALLLIAVLLAFCSCVGSRIYQGRNRMQMQLGNKVMAMSAREEIPGTGPVVMTRDGTLHTLYVVGEANDDGMLSLDLSPVTVTAPLKMIPERNGKVDLEFTMSLPSSILFSSSRILLEPELLLEDGTIHNLEPLDLFGKSFLELQDRSYFLYERFLERKGEYDAQDEERIFNRFVRFPFLSGMRLDTLFRSGDRMHLSYAQTVPTLGLSRTLLRVALKVRAQAIDGSTAAFPLKDTLEYRISSLLSFMDRRTRYKMIVRDKHVKERRSYYLSFKTGSGTIDFSNEDNHRAALDMLSALERPVLEDGLVLDSLSIEAWASPEGRQESNLDLSARRGQALSDYLIEQQGGALPLELKVLPRGEDITGLTEYVQRDSLMVSSTRKEILEVLEDGYLSEDDKENYLKTTFPKEWGHLLLDAFPRLRRVDLVLGYNRVEQKKDTVHLQQVDEAYMKALDDLSSRRYQSALEVLDAHKDMNTALCMLSLGYDGRALDVLETGACEKGTSAWHYLRAVCLSRLNRITEAKDAFREACLQDESLELRGELDPEINPLL